MEIEWSSSKTLNDVINYNPDTGKATWKKRDTIYFRGNDRTCRTWNSNFSGNPCLNSIHKDGYLKGMVNSKMLLSHRVFWAMCHDEWPEQIDHINGIRDDNRLCNLRAANDYENSRNRKLPQNNTSGVVGVYFQKSSGKWKSQILTREKTVYLGLFLDFNDAVLSRIEAEKKYGYHKNHGRIKP